MSAKGIPNESTTWLITRARDGSTRSLPNAITTKAGTIVTARRTNTRACENSDCEKQLQRLVRTSQWDEDTTLYPTEDRQHRKEDVRRPNRTAGDRHKRAYQQRNHENGRST